MRPPPDRTRATWRRQTTWSWKGRAPRSRRPRAPWRCAFASIGWGPSARDVWRNDRPSRSGSCMPSTTSVLAAVLALVQALEARL